MARDGSNPQEVGTTTQSPAQINPTTFDLDTFKTYLNLLVPVLLGQDNIQSLFDDKDFSAVATRFASDPSQAVVYVVKDKDEQDNPEGTHTTAPIS